MNFRCGTADVTDMRDRFNLSFLRIKEVREKAYGSDK